MPHTTATIALVFAAAAQPAPKAPPAPAVSTPASPAAPADPDLLTLRSAADTSDRWAMWLLAEVTLGRFAAAGSRPWSFPDVAEPLWSAAGRAARKAPVDLAQGIEWHRKAAAAGNTASMRALSLMHLRGRLGVKVDVREASSFMVKAADAGDPFAQVTLANWARQGANGQLRSVDRAKLLAQRGLPILEQLAMRGHAEAMFELGQMLRYDGLLRADRARSGALIEQAAVAGWAPALVETARTPFAARDEKAKAEARRRLERASALREPEAMFILAEEAILHPGRSATTPAQGVRQMVVAAEYGEPDAQAFVGHALIEGVHGFAKSPADGVTLLRTAYRGGSLRACTALALLHLDGNHVTKDEKRAIEMLTTAAELGHPEACVLLGSMHLAGKHVGPRDARKAADFFQKASLAGDPTACRLLGEMYLHGDGVARDEARARTYLGLAARLGDAHADETLRTIAPPANASTASPPK